MDITLQICKGKSIYWAAKDHEIPMTILFYKIEGKFTKREIGPVPELKEYESLLESWIKEYVKNSVILCQKEGLLESVQKIVTSAKLKRKKEIRKLEIPMKKQKKSARKKEFQEISTLAKHY